MNYFYSRGFVPVPVNQEYSLTSLSSKHLSIFAETLSFLIDVFISCKKISGGVVVNNMNKMAKDPEQLFNASLVILISTALLLKSFDNSRRKRKSKCLVSQEDNDGNLNRSSEEKVPDLKSKCLVSQEDNGENLNRRSEEKVTDNDDDDDDDDILKENVKSERIKSLQLQFLPVFWLLRTAFWMSGPYFYAAYASKIVNGNSMSMALISQIFIAGYASIALFGPVAGRLLDEYGPKKGTIAAAFIYTLGALSTQSSSIIVLFVGRALGGIGTCLMSSAPEAWLVNEVQKSGDDLSGKWLSETFGWAYSMDSIVAIAAGQLASHAARHYGPTGPFRVSPFFLLLSIGLTICCWKKKPDVASARKRRSSRISLLLQDQLKEPSIFDAFDSVQSNPKLIMVGAIQSLFESSMYAFVMVWPQAMIAVIQKAYGTTNTSIPFGTIFSCFMACSMLGSSLFSKVANRSSMSVEDSTICCLIVACISLAGAVISMSNTNTNICLYGLMVSFFIFEACVGMYFPSIGTIRSKYLPCENRASIMTLFSVPSNILVVSIGMILHKVGTKGVLCIATIQLLFAILCMIRLQFLNQEDLKSTAKLRWDNLKGTFKAAILVSMMTQGSAPIVFTYNHVWDIRHLPKMP